MIKTTVQVSGMVCGMCETHVNDAIRSAFTVKKVHSSRVKGETVIESDNPIDTDKLKQVISATGYIALSVSEEEIMSKGRMWRL
jgi:copper chaperone CopZ